MFSPPPLGASGERALTCSIVAIDGDNKPDYYYHTNGKLYAVKGSSGVGDATCEVKYGDDGKLNSVEINEGFEGGFGTR